MENSTSQVNRVAFIGLGSMGTGMASCILRNTSYQVQGFDSYAPCMEPFAAIGGKTTASAREAVQNAQLVIFMVVSDSQVEQVLFDEAQGILEGPS